MCSILLVDLVFSHNFSSIVHAWSTWGEGELGEGRVKAVHRIWEEVRDLEGEPPSVQKR